MNFNIPIILASKSPRRQELLTALGLKFQVKSAHINEQFPRDLALDEVPEFLARKKAEAVNSSDPGALIIAADTIVLLDNTMLGKPRNSDEAVVFLRRLSGVSHRVITGVCLKYLGKTASFKEITEVTFRRLDDAEIAHYVENYQPMDKAGGYGIQEWIGLIGVEKIDGSYFNVVGLPVQKLYQKLKELEPIR